MWNNVRQSCYVVVQYIGVKQRERERTIMAEDYQTTISEYIDRLKYKSQIRKSNLVIEKSTSYYESLLALSRFEYGFKNSRFIMILRDPLERAISNYFFKKMGWKLLQLVMHTLTFIIIRVVYQ